MTRINLLWRRKRGLILPCLTAVGAIALLPASKLFSQPVAPKPNNSAVKKPVAMPGSEMAISTTVNQWRDRTRSLMLSLSIPNRYQGKVFEDVKIKANPKVIALTFDDGPWLGSTDRILDILKRYNVKATFYIIGRNLQLYPQIGQRIVSQGHAIANHTWSHSYSRLNWATSAREIDNTTNLIYKVTGVKSYVFRPPGGFLNNGPAGYAKAKKYAITLWSADSNDWKRPSVGTLVNSVMKEASPGGMVLMHDGGGDRSHTIKALPQIIAQLRSKGYSFVTVPELLDMGEQSLPVQQIAKSIRANPKK